MSRKSSASSCSFASTCESSKLYSRFAEIVAWLNPNTREAIDLLQKKPAEASKLIASYFIAEPTLKTLKKGELPREAVIADAIKSQTFNAALTQKELSRMQEIAGIMQEQGALIRL